MSDSKGQFQSIFKINGRPILAPLVSDQLRKEIIEIKNICKTKEEKLKLQKDLANESKKNEMRSRSDSYTITTPFFNAHELPDVDNKTIETQQEVTKEEINESVSLQSEVVAEEENDDIQTKKDDVVVVEEKPEQSIEIPTNEQIKSQLTDLIKKQKNEYLMSMQILRRKFEQEQREFLQKLQNLNMMTSTPLTNVSLAPTDDEEFTEFQSCLQQQQTSLTPAESEVTLINDQEVKEKAAIIINKYIRGYLTRRLFRTSYVQQCINNIHDTLNLVLTMRAENPVQRTEKIRIYEQLKVDLYRLHDVFFKLSIKEKMNLIAFDRERLRNKEQSLMSDEHFERSLQGL